MPHGVMPPEQLPSEPLANSPMPVVAGARAGELELRAVAVDAAVVGGRGDDVPDAVLVALDVEDRVADRVLLELDVLGGLGVLAGEVLLLVAVLEERARVLVVGEQQALVRLALEREEREEVVVVAPRERLAGVVGELVAVAHDDVRAVALGHLERVGRRRRDRREVGERRRAGLGVRDGGAEEVEPRALERGGGGRRGAGRGDPADEAAPGGLGQLAGLRHGRRSMRGNVKTRRGPVVTPM